MAHQHSNKVGGVPYRFIPASPGGKFAPIYRHLNDPGDNLVSVNAGDNGLYVGGGTIKIGRASCRERV